MRTVAAIKIKLVLFHGKEFVSTSPASTDHQLAFHFSLPLKVDRQKFSFFLQETKKSGLKPAFVWLQTNLQTSLVET